MNDPTRVERLVPATSEAAPFDAPVAAAPSRTGDEPRAPDVPRATDQPYVGNGLRPDLQIIADWIAPGSRVLDLGCGDGALLAYLKANKRCIGYGVEIDPGCVLACVRRGVNVIQQNIEDGLGMFHATKFDVVVTSMAIQATSKTEQVLDEMSQVGKQGIVSFPNFGHWRHAWSLLLGRMPVSETMPYRWYDTPNLHLSTIPDFEEFLREHRLDITGRAYVAGGRPIDWLPTLRARQAIYRFKRH